MIAPILHILLRNMETSYSLTEMFVNFLLLYHKQLESGIKTELEATLTFL